MPVNEVNPGLAYLYDKGYANGYRDAITHMEELKLKMEQLIITIEHMEKGTSS